MNLTWINGRLAISQHNFSAKEMLGVVGTLWVPADGTDHVVVVRKAVPSLSSLQMAQTDITYEYLPRGDVVKEFTKDSFNFQSRYRLVVMQLASPDCLLM